MWRERYGSKYGNKTHIYEGIAYHSKKEAGYAVELDLRKKAGDIKSWQRQVRIPLEFKGNHIANYYVDFQVEHNDGRTEFVEVKGFETEVWRLKWKMFEAMYGDDSNYILTVVK